MQNMLMVRKRQDQPFRRSDAAALELYGPASPEARYLVVTSSPEGESCFTWTEYWCHSLQNAIEMTRNVCARCVGLDGPTILTLYDRDEEVGSWACLPDSTRHGRIGWWPAPR